MLGACREVSHYGRGYNNSFSRGLINNCVTCNAGHLRTFHVALFFPPLIQKKSDIRHQANWAHIWKTLTKKKFYVLREEWSGSKCKNDKRGNNDNDPNSYFASYIYTMHVCVYVCAGSVSAVCLGNDCFLTWMPCNHICILFYHGHTAVPPLLPPNTHH